MDVRGQGLRVSAARPAYSIRTHAAASVGNPLVTKVNDSANLPVLARLRPVSGSTNLCGATELERRYLLSPHPSIDPAPGA